MTANTKNEKIEAHGIKGMKSTKWRKTFTNWEALELWVEKNDAEVHGTRTARPIRITTVSEFQIKIGELVEEKTKNRVKMAIMKNYEKEDFLLEKMTLEKLRAEIASHYGIEDKEETKRAVRQFLLNECFIAWTPEEDFVAFMPEHGDHWEYITGYEMSEATE